MTLLAFLGGTGPEGRGLALRFALLGNEVVIGSRDVNRAREAAAKVKACAPSVRVVGTENSEAATMGDVAFITVPYEAQKPLLQGVTPSLKGKIVVDTVSPIVIQGGVAQAITVEEGSAAMQAQVLLPDSLVVAAFHHVSAVHLLVPHRIIQGDVVVCSDHADARQRVMEMVVGISELRGVDGGGLVNARYVEELTALLLNINRIYQSRTSIKLVGI